LGCLKKKGDASRLTDLAPSRGRGVLPRPPTSLVLGPTTLGQSCKKPRSGLLDERTEDEIQVEPRGRELFAKEVYRHRQIFHRVLFARVFERVGIRGVDYEVEGKDALVGRVVGEEGFEGGVEANGLGEGEEMENEGALLPRSNQPNHLSDDAIEVVGYEMLFVFDGDGRSEVGLERSSIQLDDDDLLELQSNPFIASPGPNADLLQISQSR